MLPLRAIIGGCVALRIHPNTLTLIGVIVNVGAAWALAFGRFILAFVLMLVANIFDFIDGKVAHQLQLQSEFGAFWDSTLDRFSDLALLTGLIFLYSKLGRSDYVLIAALSMHDLWLRTVGTGADPAIDDPPSQSVPLATGVFNEWSFWQYSGTCSRLSGLP